MVEKIRILVENGFERVEGACFRYGMLERLSKSAGIRGVEVVAFGIGRCEVRLLLEGSADDVTNVLRGFKVGTRRVARTAGVPLIWGEQFREPVTDEQLEEAVAWAHSAVSDSSGLRPLASPWTSHRDLMGFRRALFFDATALRERVDPKRVHELAAGGPMPRCRSRRKANTETLDTLLRIAASVKGVLPADRRCFGLFCQLATARGYNAHEIAGALALTARRARQLRNGEDPQLDTALRCLRDPRLSVVP